MSLYHPTMVALSKDERRKSGSGPKNKCAQNGDDAEFRCAQGKRHGGSEQLGLPDPDGKYKLQSPTGDSTSKGCRMTQFPLHAFKALTRVLCLPC